VRCFAPRFFGFALARKGQGRRLRLAQNDRVRVFLNYIDRSNRGGTGVKKPLSQLR
jgi:hypothetical protein